MPNAEEFIYSEATPSSGSSTDAIDGVVGFCYDQLSRAGMVGSGTSWCRLRYGHSSNVLDNFLFNAGSRDENGVCVIDACRHSEGLQGQQEAVRLEFDTVARRVNAIKKAVVVRNPEPVCESLGKVDLSELSGVGKDLVGALRVKQSELSGHKSQAGEALTDAKHIPQGRGDSDHLDLAIRKKSDSPSTSAQALKAERLDGRYAGR